MEINNLKQIVKKSNFKYISNMHFWRKDEMKLEELVYDILQSGDRKSLHALLRETKIPWKKYFELMLSYSSEFNKFSPFHERYNHIVNYMILLRRLRRNKDRARVLGLEKTKFYGELEEDDFDIEGLESVPEYE